MGCCSTFSLLITLAFTAGFAAMVGIGATNKSLPRHTANGLVCAGSVCLVWSLIYLGIAFGYSTCGENAVDNTFYKYMHLKSERSGNFVVASVCFSILSFIASIVLIAVGGAKQNTGMWAAGVANLGYTLVTGMLFIFLTCCCCTIGHAFNH